MPRRHWTRAAIRLKSGCRNGSESGLRHASTSPLFKSHSYSRLFSCAGKVQAPDRTQLLWQNVAKPRAACGLCCWPVYTHECESGMPTGSGEEPIRDAATESLAVANGLCFLTQELSGDRHFGGPSIGIEVVTGHTSVRLSSGRGIGPRRTSGTGPVNSIGSWELACGF